MDIGGVIPKGAAAPDGSPVVHAPALVSPPAPEGAGASAPTRETTAPRGEERAHSAPVAFAADSAVSTRHGTRFHLSDPPRRLIAEIVDANNKVIKEIPPKEVVEIAARFRRLVGLLFDEQA
ncbi:MAG: flagellar protein FlaG [Candidatus Hydrogenedentes bacterium]|nr:flagellar protein FlaG [Candidatus Hydrogenedentota bacterium]